MEDNKRMKKAAGILESLFKLIGGVLCAMVIVCGIFAVLVLVFGEKMFVPETFVTLDIGFLKFYLREEYRFISDDVKLYAVVSLLTAAGLYGVISYVCVLLRRILSPMKDGRPFEAGMAKDLRKIAWVVLGGGLYSEVLKIAEHLLMIRAYPMEKIFNSEAIYSMSHTIDVDLGFVLVAAAFFLLSYIFSYGQTLQRESDETL